MKIKYFAIAVLGVFLTLTSCDDFLDKIPDTRVELNTPEQLRLLLVNGYPNQNIALMCELSSDNYIDNNSTDPKSGARFNLPAYDKVDDEIFAWEEAKSSISGDSPSALWESSYHAIAVANEVIARIPYFEAQGKGDEVKPMLGEALVIRAYNHFLLANLFCQGYRGPEMSKTMQGIPYMEKPETTVRVEYARLDLQTVYEKIEQDLIAGLEKIDDNIYEQPKYHFNKAAANAFAARFYLFTRQYDKCLEHANLAFGGVDVNVSMMLSDIWSKEFTSPDLIAQHWISVTQPHNFLIVPTYSVFHRRFGKRYTINRDGAKASCYGPGPVWTAYNFHPCYSGKLYISGSQEYGVYFPKNCELFEYTNKVAGIGYPHIVRAEFTAEETLLTRAEAKLYLGDKEGALADLNLWLGARNNNTTSAKLDPLTHESIKAFYIDRNPNYLFGIVKPINVDKFCPSDKYTLTDDMVGMMQCIQHFRRMETITDGYRWFDIKRLGLEIEHQIGKDNVIKKLTYDDPRKAFQIPAEVIAAGMEPTKRELVKKAAPAVKANASYIPNNE